LLRFARNDSTKSRHCEERSDEAISMGNEVELRRMPPSRFALLVICLITLALAGCGKKGNPQAPPGEPDTYPRTYPSG
jgi:hypothetical protein